MVNHPEEGAMARPEEEDMAALPERRPEEEDMAARPERPLEEEDMAARPERPLEDSAAARPERRPEDMAARPVGSAARPWACSLSLRKEKDRAPLLSP
jgi:hypothetical protein